MAKIPPQSLFRLVIQIMWDWVILPDALEAVSIVGRDGGIVLCDTPQRTFSLPCRVRALADNLPIKQFSQQTQIQAD